LFEAIFSYFIVRGFIDNNPTLSLYWFVPLLLKIALGYLVYVVLVSENKKFKVIGLVITIVMITFPYIFHYAGLEFINKIIGGPQFFIIAVNTMTLIRFWRHPLRLPTGEKINNRTSIVMVFFMLATAIIYSGFVVLGAFLSWIIFISVIYRIAPLKKLDIDQIS
jgi:hypothetical protein